MKICVPVELNQGLDSKPFGHFGSAPMFVICDLESGEVKGIDNGDLGHEHGKCQPLKALSGIEVDAVIVGGIGQGAIMKLNQMGIKVYRAQEGSIGDNLNYLKENRLQEFPANHSCSHDGCNHH
ncbi:NifB/NifX family molybdenum-iron cluster-binding protein [Romboutsia sp.]|uniref:NifB/NifX family molybdenum-iron cluster-binding protein n=1 Tax=Romboutsia sp. TaxID=1965302 RepID=UPI003F2B8554